MNIQSRINSYFCPKELRRFANRRNYQRIKFPFIDIGIDVGRASLEVGEDVRNVDIIEQMLVVEFMCLDFRD